MRALKILREAIHIIIFIVGVVTIYSYIKKEFPGQFSIVVNSLWIIAAIWYFWEDIAKKFISGYKEETQKNFSK